ncbi:MAG: hypothetical protein CML21_00490 [Rheinheimera sp.]|nr:hypothetical protein [Rheinheimera sp.]
MLGHAFECVKYEVSGKTRFLARTLDAHTDNGFIFIVVQDGEIESRLDNCPNAIISSNSSEYLHGTLTVDESTGLVSFDPLPYRADPYPGSDVHFSDVYVHVSENKVWAIKEDSSGNQCTVYKNDVTKQRFVFQEISGNQTLSQRIQSKIQKGYIKINPAVFSVVDRTLN